MTETELQLNWRAQPAAAPKLSLDYLMFLNQQFERNSRRVHRSTCIAFALGVAFFAWWSVFMAETLFGRALAVLLAAGNLYGWYDYRKMIQKAKPPLESSQHALKFYRRQLEHKRDLTRWDWRRVVPGYVAIVLILVAQRIQFPHLNGLLIPEAIFVILISVFAYVDARRQRGRLQAEIDGLAKLGSD